MIISSKLTIAQPTNVFFESNGYTASTFELSLFHIIMIKNTNSASYVLQQNTETENNTLNFTHKADGSSFSSIIQETKTCWLL